MTGGNCNIYRQGVTIKLVDPFIWTNGGGNTGHAQVEIGGGEKPLGASKNKEAGRE